jgi:hypothetical protein
MLLVKYVVGIFVAVFLIVTTSNAQVGIIIDVIFGVIIVGIIVDVFYY